MLLFYFHKIKLNITSEKIRILIFIKIVKNGSLS